MLEIKGNKNSCIHVNLSDTGISKPGSPMLKDTLASLGIRLMNRDMLNDYQLAMLSDEIVNIVKKEKKNNPEAIYEFLRKNVSFLFEELRDELSEELCEDK